MFGLVVLFPAFPEPDEFPPPNCTELSPLLVLLFDFFDVAAVVLSVVLSVLLLFVLLFEEFSVLLTLLMLVLVETF